MIQSLAVSDPTLYEAFLDAKRLQDGWSHFVRHSDCYPLCGRGRINTYAVFAENMRRIVSPTGRVGCIVPSGIATDDTTKQFFKDLMETHTLTSIYSFENEEFIFPAVHHATKFCLLTILGHQKTQQATDFVFFARQTQDLKDDDRHFSLSAADIALLNPNTHTCPVFRSKHDMELTRAIYKYVPVLIREFPDRVNVWDITLRQGIFNMTSASHLFRTNKQLEKNGWELRENVFYRGEERYLPLYEAKMIWHFDHRFGTYEGQTQAQANQGKLPEFDGVQHADPLLFPRSQYWVHETDFSAALRGDYTAFLGFRDVTNSAVLRTSVFSIFPVTPCNHKLPLVFLNQKPSVNLLYLESCFASFIFDYIARQKIGGTSFGFFILKQLPVLPPTTYQQSCSWFPTQSLGDWVAPRALELTYTAWDLEAFAQDCGYGGPPFRWNEERRFLLRCELDAAYFILYGIARDDVAYIMDTFRVWKEKEEKRFGEYRTKRVILEIYDEMMQATENGQTYNTHLRPQPADPTQATVIEQQHAS